MFATLATLALIGVPCTSSWSSSSAAWSATGEAPPSPALGGSTVPCTRHAPPSRLAAAAALALRRRLQRRRRRHPGRRRRARPSRRPSARHRAAVAAASRALTVGLGFIPSVQFAQFYLAEQSGRLRRRRPRRDAPEQDRPRPHHARSARAPSTSASATAPRSSRPSARASRSSTRRRSTASSRRSSWPRPTSGIKTAADLEGKKHRHPRQYGSSWIMLQALLGSAGLTPDDVDDRRVPGLRPGGRAPAGRRRRRHRVRQQRADPARARPASSRSCSRSTTSCRCPAPGLVTGKATLDGEARRPRGVHGGDARRDGPDRRRPPEGPRRDLRRGARPRRGPGPPAPDPRRHHRDLDEPAPGPLWRDRRDGWQQSLDFMTGSAWCPTPSPSTSWSTSRCSRRSSPSLGAAVFQVGVPGGAGAASGRPRVGRHALGMRAVVTGPVRSARPVRGRTGVWLILLRIRIARRRREVRRSLVRNCPGQDAGTPGDREDRPARERSVEHAAAEAVRADDRRQEERQLVRRGPGDSGVVLDQRSAPVRLGPRGVVRDGSSSRGPPSPARTGRRPDSGLARAGLARTPARRTPAPRRRGREDDPGR